MCDVHPDDVPVHVKIGTPARLGRFFDTARWGKGKKNCKTTNEAALAMTGIKKCEVEGRNSEALSMELEAYLDNKMEVRHGHARSFSDDQRKR